MLGLGGAAAAMSLGGCATIKSWLPAYLGGTPARPAATPAAAGSRIWLDMDQKQLDAAYDQAAYAPNRDTVLKRYEAESERVRARIGAPRRFSYGSEPIEALDWYATDRPNAPVHIFLHGGAWRGGTSKEYGFPAELVTRAGAHYVVPDFVSVIDAGGNLQPMADQVRRAIAWVYRHARRHGADPERITLSAHSSGAHLAAVALTSDWWQDFNLPKNLVKNALLCSGLYDLRPVRLSSRSNYVKFTDAMEEALSPQRHLDRLATPLIIAYASGDTPEFQRQSRDFAAAVKAAGKPVQLLVGQHYNHFELLETMGSPYGVLGEVVGRMVK
ncbi:arylformamidase [Noviherbaspirillum humi]|uniref:Arylformamidase n=2 Tax=Noviherbaspirillum humi TaxID=1688639 RepID=A0A239FCN6_9BURK|nr:arylformamidase [Noviherbaspirillum humi]